MKIKEEYVIQQIADKWVVIDTDSRSVNFNKILSLNETGSFLWKKLEEGADRQGLVSALTGEYDIENERAVKDVEKFINELYELGCVEENE